MIPNDVVPLKKTFTKVAAVQKRCVCVWFALYKWWLCTNDGSVQMMTML